MQKKTVFFSLFALLIFFAGAHSSALSQVEKDLLEKVRVVDDPEGKVNVRYEASLDGAVDRTLRSGSVI